MITQQQSQHLQASYTSAPLAALQWMIPPSSGMSPGLVQPVTLVGTSLWLHRLLAMTYIDFCS